MNILDILKNDVLEILNETLTEMIDKHIEKKVNNYLNNSNSFLLEDKDKNIEPLVVSLLINSGLNINKTNTNLLTSNNKLVFSNSPLPNTTYPINTQVKIPPGTTLKVNSSIRIDDSRGYYYLKFDNKYSLSISRGKTTNPDNVVMSWRLNADSTKLSSYNSTACVFFDYDGTIKILSSTDNVIQSNQLINIYKLGWSSYLNETFLGPPKNKDTNSYFIFTRNGIISVMTDPIDKTKNIVNNIIGNPLMSQVNLSVFPFNSSLGDVLNFSNLTSNARFTISSGYYTNNNNTIYPGYWKGFSVNNKMFIFTFNYNYNIELYYVPPDSSLSENLPLILKKQIITNFDKNNYKNQQIALRCDLISGIHIVLNPSSSDPNSGTKLYSIDTVDYRNSNDLFFRYDVNLDFDLAKNNYTFSIIQYTKPKYNNNNAYDQTPFFTNSNISNRYQTSVFSI